MCDTETIVSRGFLALKEILEEGVRSGADSVEFEYGDEGLEVFLIAGGVGLGKVLRDRDLIRGIIRAIIQGARLERKERGKMRLQLLGKDHTIVASQHESFGEWSYRLEFGADQSRKLKN